VGAFRFLMPGELRVLTTAHASVDRHRVVLMPDRLRHFGDDLWIAEGPVGMPEKDSRSDLCVDQTPPRTWPVQSQGVIKPLPM
jgi:hypothetical protein